MTQQAPFHPSDDDIHHLLEHDNGVHSKHAKHLHTRRHHPSRVLWRYSQFDTKPVPNADPTGAKAAIHPHFDHLDDPQR